MPNAEESDVRRAVIYDRPLRHGHAVVRAEPARVEGGVGVVRRVGDVARVRAIAIDAAVLVALTAATAAVYVWTKAPLYNPFGTIDPWLYTALWTNFDQIYDSFPRTYYISRVPWIVPGYVLNEIFDARTAALVLHTAFFLGGGVLFYVLCRRWLGIPAAAIGYVALIGSQMYFNAHRWDYQEGGVLTYMIGAYAFSLVRTNGPLLRAASLALGGAFAAAMVTTRIIDAAFLVGLPLLYLAVNASFPWSAWLRRFARDLAAFAAGAAVLLVACGLFAAANGEEFLYFMPQVRVVQMTSGGYNQIPVDQWLPFAPYFWVPLFVIVFAAVVLAVGPKRDRLARRVLLAAAAWLTVDYVAFAAWQFLGDGWLFNLVYYVSSFLVPTLFCLTAAAAVLIGAQSLSRRSVLIGIVCALAVLGPVVWIYRADSGFRIAAAGYRDGAYVATFVAMSVALLLVALVWMPRLRALGAAAVATAFFAVAYGVDASLATWSYGSSDPRTGGLYDAGQKLIGYLRANGYERELPHIWYDGSDVASGIGSIQSLYYYALTFIDTGMPSTNQNFLARIEAFRSDRIVLLCVDYRCKGAEPALRRAGYKPELQTLTILRAEDVRVWVKIYKVDLRTV
jgi:hypothetical protein